MKTLGLWTLSGLLLLTSLSSFAQDTGATLRYSLNSSRLSDDLFRAAQAVVKVISRGPPGAPELASSGLFFRHKDLQLVITTSHGLYHSNIIGQFFAINAKQDQVPCRILSASYEYDLALLQCQAPTWNMRMGFDFSTDTDDYYRGGEVEYWGSWLMGFPAPSSSLLIEESRNAGPAIFLKAPQQMIVPGVKSHYLAPSQSLEPGMSGGILIVSRSREYKMFAGLISKRLEGSKTGRYQRTQDQAGVIPASYVQHFITTTMWELENGRLRPPGETRSNWIEQDVYARLEHPLNVRVEQFSYQMSEKHVGEKRFKIIQIRPDENLNLNVEYSPYRGVNDFKRSLRRYPHCELSLVAESRGVSDGYRYTREDYFPIRTYESLLSLLILSEGQTNWMGLRGALMHIDCPDRKEKIRQLKKMTEAYRELQTRSRSELQLELPYSDYVSDIEKKVLDPQAENLFPLNFVFPLNPPRPCDSDELSCTRKLEARELIWEMEKITNSFYQRI